MGDMGEVFRAMKHRDRERRQANLEAANPEGWTQHTQWHWSRVLSNGEKVQYWPTKNKFHYKNKTHCGGVEGFIRNEERRIANERSTKHASD